MDSGTQMDRNLVLTEQEDILEYVSRLQRLVVEVSRKLINSQPDQLDQVLLEVLEIIGGGVNADRSYLFRFRQRMDFADNTHEWCAPGVRTGKDASQGLPRTAMPKVREILEQGKVVNIGSVDGLDDTWNAERTLLLAQRIRSLVLVPIVVENNTWGHLGFDSVEVERNWHPQEIRIFQVLGELISAAIERDSTRTALLQSELLRSHAEALAHMGSWVWQVNTGEFSASEEWRQIAGCADHNVDLEVVTNLAHPEDQKVMREAIERLLESGRAQDIEHRIWRFDNGLEKWIRLHLEISQSPDGSNKVTGFVQDVTSRKQAEAALIRSEAQHRAVLDNLSEVVFQTDRYGRLTYLNLAWEETTGFGIEECLGRGLIEYIQLNFASHVHATFNALFESTESVVRFELELFAKGREPRWVEINIRRADAGSGNLMGAIGSMRDITDQREAEQKILHLARYDSLTALPNRTLILDKLEWSLNHLDKDKRIAIVFIDLDNFKKINDSLGHEFGDQALKTMAHRFAESCPDGAQIARLGGDEFLMLVENVGLPEHVEAMVNGMLSSLSEPIESLGRDVLLGASGGIALAPDHGRTPAELLRNADLAMYQAKMEAGNSCCFFTDSMQQEATRRIHIEQQLGLALKNQELRLVYQPIIDLSQGQLFGVEALVRWQNEMLGDVPVEEFIEVAENTDLILGIGYFVLDQALQQVARWRDEHAVNLKVSVNVSPRQFRDAGFPLRVAETLNQCGLDGENLELEVTENALFANPQDMEPRIRQIRDMGVTIAVDDFGTGYSSLSFLRMLPFDTIKIDQSFVCDITQDPNDMELVLTCLRLARGLDLKSVAEGVETAEQLAILVDHGCGYGQGFLFSPPLQAVDIAFRFDSHWLP